jgi:hypothetical protein
MAKRSNVPRFLAPIFLGAAVLSALCSVGCAVEALWFSAGAHGTQGVVSALIAGADDGQRAVVQFQVNNRTVTIQSQVAWEPPAYRVGQTVPVLYPSGEPERGRVDSFWEQMPAILAGIFAVVFGLVSVGTGGDEPVANQATTALARRVGCLVYLAAFFVGALALVAAGIARLLAFGGAAGLSVFFVLAGLCVLLFCGYQFHRAWSCPEPAPVPGLTPGGILAWELPRDRPGRVGLAGVGLFTLLWNGGLAVLLTALLRGELAGWAPLVVVLLILGGLLGLGLLALLVFIALLEVPALVGARPARIEVSDSSFAPGEAGEVLVVQPGPARLREWQVLLLCEHQAVFQEGEDAPAEIRLVHQEELLRQEELVIEPGVPDYTARRSLRIPREALPCRAGDDVIRWKILVRGHCGDWRPGFTFEFPLAVVAR